MAMLGISIAIFNEFTSNQSILDQWGVHDRSAQILCASALLFTGAVVVATSAFLKLTSSNTDKISGDKSL
jgi:hypothetical protein